MILTRTGFLAKTQIAELAKMGKRNPKNPVPKFAQKSNEKDQITRRKLKLDSEYSEEETAQSFFFFSFFRTKFEEINLQGFWRETRGIITSEN